MLNQWHRNSGGTEGRYLSHISKEKGSFKSVPEESQSDPRTLGKKTKPKSIKQGKQTQPTNGFNGGLHTRFQARDLEARSQQGKSLENTRNLPGRRKQTGYV